jgi:hypothetical protein
MRFAGVLLASLTALHCAPQETLLSPTENAYNPIPSPDGKLIAFVRTGWGHNGGSGGLGRSNLVSEISVMDAQGRVLPSRRKAGQFLAGWTPDGKSLVAFRDWSFNLLSLDLTVRQEGRTATADAPPFPRTERVCYLQSQDKFVWLDRDGPQAFLRTVDGRISPHQIGLGEWLAPSPDERYIAVADPGRYLHVYDLRQRVWYELGAIAMHLDASWSWYQPSWDPWFRDSSRLAFLSSKGIVVSSPDGARQFVVLKPADTAGLVTSSPDGEAIAYATFAARPMEGRPNLKFYGASGIWSVRLTDPGNPRRLTGSSSDTTYNLRWLDNRAIVFDRVAERPIPPTARLWKAAAKQ